MSKKAGAEGGNCCRKNINGKSTESNAIQMIELDCMLDDFLTKIL
jgi:hypothetical protein